MSNAVDVTFSSLDPSQKNAFRAIDNSAVNLHIVHGPPGTGKSQLVVSLLERLASEDKKILFVSQNTEALKVIERMILRTEEAIGYPTNNMYVSLLDFCLMLYNPTHRHLKYLREQYTRISGKQLPIINSASTPDSVQYALQYVNLDHNENYAVSGAIVGFDELASYYMRYVNQSMAPEPIRSFEQVDVRAIFIALDNYKNVDYFAEFNHPRRELILLSTKNVALSLPDVRSKLKDIKEVLEGNWTRFFPAKEPIDIVDYLNLLKEYVTAIGMLDVYRLGTEAKSPVELARTLKAFMDAAAEITNQHERVSRHAASIREQRIDEVAGITHDSSKISLNAVTIDLAEKDFTAVLTDRKRILELTKQNMELYPDVVHVGIQDLWVGLSQAVNGFFGAAALTNDDPIGKLKADDIHTLINDLHTYDAQNGVKRMLSGVPASFKQLLGIMNAKELDRYRNEVEANLRALKDLLELSGDTIQTLLAIGKKRVNTPLSRIGVKSPDTIEQAVDALLPVHGLVLLLQKYGIDFTDFGITKIRLREFDSGVTALHALTDSPANKKLYLTASLDDFISAINASIDLAVDVQRLSELESTQKDLQNESYLQNGHYLANITEPDEYADRVETVYGYLSHKDKSLASLFTAMAIPDNNLPIEADLDKIEKVITDANLSDNFSDFFFEMHEGQTFFDWLSSVTVLETYNNDAEIVDFIEHNQFITTIRTAMGADNNKYIDDVLANDITFAVFAARIVNVVVGESFGRARLADKKHVTTADIIGAYEAYLKNQKASTYRENIRHIYNRSFSGATKELSKQSTLQAGGKSTMDKFRRNTKLISEAFPIICATPKDVSKYLADGKALFDYVIFDEASQLLPGQAIPSMYRAKKAVIIGDPHQMPPSLNASFSTVDQSEDEFDDLGESILDLALKQPQTQHHLKVHYRSKYNKLFEPSREVIYSNDGIEPIFEAELANGAPIDIIDDLGEGQDEHGYDKNFYKICESINEYLEEDNKADFCILFTRADVLAKFKDFLAEVGERQFNKVLDLYGADRILISTVTNCQGIEGAFTLIYLHHYHSPGAMWFFKEGAGAYKRLNVSITRQREGLKLLLADQRSHWLKVCEEKINRSSTGPNTLKSAELMKALLTNAGEQADTTYLDRKLGQNTSWFDSPLTQQLYDKLTKHYAETIGRDIKIYSEVGWNLLIPTGEGIDANERNVGFRIDLGIYSVKHKKFVLGVEMDGAMYHSGFDREHSDYNRQKVLEDKGWKLYRIWSTNWLNDNEREFTRLVQEIDANL